MFSFGSCKRAASEHSILAAATSLPQNSERAVDKGMQDHSSGESILDYENEITGG
jgi:hypothetical protein